MRPTELPGCRGRVSLGACVLLACSCAPPATLRVSTLVDEARVGEVAAYAKRRGKRLRVRGVVASTGLRSTEEIVVHRSYGGLSATGQTHEVPHPYVYLSHGEVPSADRLLCYFHRDDVDEVARVQARAWITVSGDFFGYAPLPGEGLQVMLSRCEVETD